MGFLPYSVIKLRTDLTPAEVYQKLRELVETSSANSNDGKNGLSKKPYKGKVEYDSFEIVRRIGYKNSFVPKIKGVVCNNGMYTAIRLRLRPSAFVLGFMLLWLIPVFLTCLWAIYISFKEGFEPGMAMPFGMFYSDFSCLVLVSVWRKKLPLKISGSICIRKRIRGFIPPLDRKSV